MKFNLNEFISNIKRALSFALLKSLFDNDNSEIVSKKGYEILNDKHKMELVYEKLRNNKGNDCVIINFEK